MRALALLALLPLTAHAAEMNSCKVYANRGSAIALRQLLGLPFIDPTAGKFLYRKAYTGTTLRDHLGLSRPAVGEYLGPVPQSKAAVS